MARWRPDAHERLHRAALELFAAHGFEEVTVPQITAHAGLTTRTFHRHFADKREVLFAGDGELPALAARLVLAAPPGLAPLDVIAHGLSTLAAQAFEGRHAELRRHRTVVDAHDGLRERELRKMDALTDAVTDAFVRRGLDEVTAAVVARVGVGVVQVAIRRWLTSDGSEPLATVMADCLDRTRAALQGGPRGAPDGAASLPQGSAHA